MIYIKLLVMYGRCITESANRYYFNRVASGSETWVMGLIGVVQIYEDFLFLSKNIKYMLELFKLSTTICKSGLRLESLNVLTYNTTKGVPVRQSHGLLAVLFRMFR